MPGRPKNGVSRDPPDRERTSRLHRDLPEVDASDLPQHALDQVVVADRDAAGSEHDVRRAGGLEETLAEALADVGHDAEVERLGAGALDHAAERVAVRVVDLSRATRLARLHHLVSGGEQGDAGPTVYPQLGEAERRDETQVLRTQHGARLEHDRPGPDVLAAGSHVRSGVDRAKVDPVSRALAELLRHDGVRPARHRRAGHDAERLARADAALVDRAGGKVRHHANAHAAPRDEVRCPDGVPVHGRVVSGRDVEGGPDFRGQDAPEPPRDRKGLLRRGGRHVGEDASPGFRDGNHGGARSLYRAVCYSGATDGRRARVDRDGAASGRARSHGGPAGRPVGRAGVGSRLRVSPKVRTSRVSFPRESGVAAPRSSWT